MKLFSFLRKNLKTPFRIVFLNKDNLVEEYAVSTRIWYYFVIFFILLTGMGVLGYFSRNWISPRTTIDTADISQETVRKLEEELIKLDKKNSSNENYIEDLQLILNGNVPKSDIDQNAGEINPENMVDEQYDSIQIADDHHTVVQSSNTASASKSQEVKINPNPGEEAAYQFYFTPLSGLITNKYDPLKNHPAIDIQGQVGEPIKSIADGVVLFADWTSSTGYVVMIQHTNNVISVYKHNSQVYKKLGNKVKMGEVIAAVGNTGELTSGPHLHFEMWVNGLPENPEKFISF